MWGKFSILLILVLVAHLGETKHECSKKCDCSEDFSVVKCQNEDKFPVFSFASKVKTLDLSNGNIKILYKDEIKAYKNLENLFIAGNPIDCSDPETATVMKRLQKKNRNRLKSFDGYKIKCERKKFPRVEAHIVARHGDAGYSNRGLAMGIALLLMIGLVTAFGVCWLIFRKRRGTCSACDLNYLDGDPMNRMEKGNATPKDNETPAHALAEGLKKQRRGSQGFPENAIVDSDDGDVVEQEDYLRQKMKKQRRMSQGYADGYKSADDESTAVEVLINEDLCAQRK
ncbi:hypothetical protein P5673_015881 [Acropora cervicornis]|uniref:Uncharacterized protein n=1 Tax=Acropora cervicornis TaxID=6130 RepID=A0AAD9QHD6_ACRCE|nr:hypothetical protein P5673_015881 [Acropora cervicornis]